MTKKRESRQIILQNNYSMGRTHGGDKKTPLTPTKHLAFDFSGKTAFIPGSLCSWHGYVSAPALISSDVNMTSHWTR